MLRGQNVIFLTDNEAVAEKVKRYSMRCGVELTPQIQPIESLHKFERMDELYEKTKLYGKSLPCTVTNNLNLKEKGIVHYFRDYWKTKKNAFKKMFSIWHSKIDIVNLVMDQTPLEIDEFAWVDASISRMNGRRPRWRFTDVNLLNTHQLMHYGSQMQKNNRLLRLSAGFLLADRTTFRAVKKKYDLAFEQSQYEIYPHDEETILDFVAQENPSLFIRI
jgi:hypothetical protein